MKNKKAELDIDFIQSKDLSKEEEKKLSEYIRKVKEKRQKIDSKNAA